MTKAIFNLHPDIGNVFNDDADLLIEIVNFGTHVLNWDIESAVGSDEQLPILLILRNILEHLDALSILIRKSSIEPCKSLLRVMFESILNLEYMLKDDTHRRALAFLVCGYHNELKFIEKITRGTDAHHQLKQKFKADKTMKSGLPPIDIPGKDAQATLLANMLKLPLYQEVEKEYQRLVAAGKNNPSWYHFFNGPPNIDQLATKLERQGLYELFYRAWSGTVHGQNVVKGNITNGVDSGIAQIRHPKDGKQVTLHSCNLTLLLYHLYIDKRIPAKMEQFKTWYKTIQPEMARLRADNHRP